MSLFKTEPQLLASIIIPVLNEEAQIEQSLKPLQYLRKRGVELILVDGGSTDKTVKIAQPLVDVLIGSNKGRAKQMNAGAQIATGIYLVFLHADTRLPKTFFSQLKDWQADNIKWGFFSLKLSGEHWLFRIIERAINYRSRKSKIGTGDQVIFCHRVLFNQLGGYPDISLMEDIALCKQLKTHTAFSFEQQPVITSSRRWQDNGILSTVLLMWRLRLAYFFGAKPENLAAKYYSK